MLMPERYVEDGSTQCIPVTHTRYVTKEEEVRKVLAADEGLTSYAASPGVRLRFMQGVDVLDPEVALPGNGGPEELGFIQAEQEEEEGAAEMKLVLTSPGTDVNMRLTTYVMNQKSVDLRAEDMASGSEGIIVEVRQQVSGEESPRILGRQTLWEQASIDLPVKTVGLGDIEIAFSDLMNRGKFSVGTVQVTRKDVVQDNYVVMTCNTDELGGSDYRFGFNGQQKDNEIRGTGNTLDFKYRGYDARLARFFAVDPLASKYPWYTPYQFAGNTPIWARELEGLEPYFPRNYILKDLGAWGNDDQAARAWGKKVVVPAAKHIAKEVAKAGVAIVLGHPETSLFADALLGRLAGEMPVAARSAAANEAKTVVSAQRTKTPAPAEEYINAGVRTEVTDFEALEDVVSQPFTYKNITVTNRSVQNIETSISKTDFEAGLLNSGYKQVFVSKDGKAIAYSNGQSTYTIRISKNGTPTADFRSNSSSNKEPDIKIRLNSN